MDNFLRQLFDVLDQIYASHQQQGAEQAAQQQQMGAAPQQQPPGWDLTQQMLDRGDPEVGPPRPPMKGVTAGAPQFQQEPGWANSPSGRARVQVGQPQMPPKDIGAIEPLNFAQDAKSGEITPMMPGLTLTAHPDGKRTIEIPHEILNAILKTAPRKHKGK